MAMSQDTDRAEPEPLPCYRLAGEFDTKIWLEGTGWDVKVVGQRIRRDLHTVVVGVIRRSIRGEKRGLKAPLPEAIARRDIALELIFASGVEDVAAAYAVAEQLAESPDAWTPLAIKIDGERVTAYECVYAETWACGYISPGLIVYVVSRLPLSVSSVELVTVSAEELQSAEGAG
jgi:hypothetical protein